MAKTYTGCDGSLLLNGTTQLKVSNWTLEGQLDLIETTTLAECKRTYAPSIQSFSGSATLLYYKDDAGRNDASTFLRSIIKTSAVSESDKVRLTLRLTDNNVNNDITFDAFIVSVSIGAAVGDVSRAQISFQVTGTPTTVTI